jgi:predicted glycosyltransferase
MMKNLWFLPKKPEEKRILFHAINHIGLGHLNRTIAVAQWLKARIPDLQVLFLIEGGEDFIEPTGFPWVIIPGQASEREHCEQITRAVLNVFRPNLLIHDTLIREAINRSATDEGIRQVLIGRVGDVLRDQLRYNLSMMLRVDLLLIPHEREEVSQLDQALIEQYAGKTIYTGPLVRRKDQISSDDLLQKLSLTRESKVILATFGGGGYDLARRILANLLAARAQILDRYPQAKLIIISGPHSSDALPKVDEFVCYASRFEPSLTDYFDIASVVVCMAGYNTINEVAASGIPTISIPAVEAEDQVGRVEAYAQRFPHIVLGSTDAKELTYQVIGALANERDLSAVQEFWQQAEAATQRLVNEIDHLLHDTHEHCLE